MSNPYEYGTSQWAAWEKDQADAGRSTSSQYNADLLRQAEDAKRNEQELEAARQRQVKSSTCSPGETKILSPFGMIRIDSIKEGDRLVSRSRTGEIVEDASVLKVMKHKNAQIYGLTLQDGSVIRTTGSHSFLTHLGWRRADKIESGFRIQTFPDGWKEVQQSAQTSDEEPTYNLIVDRTYTFIAEGALVHSFTKFRSVQCMIWSAISTISKLVKCGLRLPEKLPTS